MFLDCGRKPEETHVENMQTFNQKGNWKTTVPPVHLRFLQFFLNKTIKDKEKSFSNNIDAKLNQYCESNSESSE